eukprot:TRINITY_DN74215_c0_g1_i1.p1 TRINITY_DN74215_c0_g1~~TRINITY_DN74215_c0_g1_i1.p1  ORF type:complete len:329 (-),score=32.44 TRINITY_DN74215_c0_g1_i1:109-1095(-)
MSYGCGTLASPTGENLLSKGTLKCSSLGGKQHKLPARACHKRIKQENVEAHWDVKQPKAPTRLHGTAKPAKFGGTELLDGQADGWTTGDFWNVDSNIRKWSEHEVRRNAASSAHDVHRHDQVTRVVLPPQEPSFGSTREMVPRQSVSGVIGADSSFLEAFGFDLGLRDRQGCPVPLWKPSGSGEHFRSQRSFTRDRSRLADNFRTMRRTMSSPGNSMPASVTRFMPEDIGGETGELQAADDTVLEKQGRTFGSRSNPYWDRYDHSVKREAAKMSCGLHTASGRSHSDSYPIKDNLELNPASVYTLKFKKGGESSLRTHVSASRRVPTH